MDRSIPRRFRRSTGGIFRYYRRRPPRAPKIVDEEIAAFLRGQIASTGSEEGLLIR